MPTPPSSEGNGEDAVPSGGLFDSLTPELVGQVSTFLSLGDDMMALCTVAGIHTASTIRRANLCNNDSYLRESLLRLHRDQNFVDRYQRIRCGRRIRAWMKVNTDWRDRCSAAKIALYKSPYRSVTISAGYLQEFFYKNSYPSEQKVFTPNDNGKNDYCESDVAKSTAAELDTIKGLLEDGSCLVEIGARDVVGLPWDEVFKLCGDIHFAGFGEDEEEVARQRETARHVKLTFLHHPDFVFNNPFVAAQLELNEVVPIVRDPIVAAAVEQGSLYKALEGFIHDGFEGFSSYHQRHAAENAAIRDVEN